MISRRQFFKYTGVAGVAALAGMALGGCGESRGAQSSSAASSTSGSAAASGAASSQASVAASSTAVASSSAAAAAKSDSIVIYFSRAGENYGVGVVEEGNTSIVAKMIAEQTGADVFEVEPAEAYPKGYDECCDVALEEQGAAVRPAIVADKDIASYKTIYLGYPIWWGDLPMCMYTFLEAHDWAGKEIHPFCTHAGSGLSGTVGKIQSACSGAEVAQGLSIEGTTAQNSRDQAKSAVEAWLA